MGVSAARCSAVQVQFELGGAAAHNLGTHALCVIGRGMGVAKPRVNKGRFQESAKET